jgi:2-iminobutanoate/2-iminopropanoate deaminase
VGVGPFLFCSGQIPLDFKTGQTLTGDIQEQTKLVMQNIIEVLKSANLNLEHVVKSTIFLTDMSDFARVNEVYSQYFKNQPPARSCVEVSALPKGANVEIEVLAYRSQ